MEKVNKWISEYIENINLEKIEWIKLNSSELNNFIRENYLDEDTWQYVRDENVNSLYPTLLGMHYLNLDITDRMCTFPDLTGFGRMLICEKYFLQLYLSGNNDIISGTLCDNRRSIWKR